MPPKTRSRSIAMKEKAASKRARRRADAKARAAETRAVMREQKALDQADEKARKAEERARAREQKALKKAEEKAKAAELRAVMREQKALDKADAKAEAKARKEAEKALAREQKAREKKSKPKKRRPAGISVIPWPPLDAPIFGLIQEQLRHKPFQLLIATIFLNKTKGINAKPIMEKFFETYPTPEALAAANEKDIIKLIRSLGLQDQRAKRLINFATDWTAQPPTPGIMSLRRNVQYPDPKTKAFPLSLMEHPTGVPPKTPFEIGHLRGIGPYAIDSWRIFCRDDLLGETDREWRVVVPMDKELRAYVRWRWAKEGKTWTEDGDEWQQPREDEGLVSPYFATKTTQNRNPVGHEDTAMEDTAQEVTPPQFSLEVDNDTIMTDAEETTSDEDEYVLVSPYFASTFTRTAPAPPPPAKEEGTCTESEDESQLSDEDEVLISPYFASTSTRTAPAPPPPANEGGTCTESEDESQLSDEDEVLVSPYFASTPTRNRTLAIRTKPAGINNTVKETTPSPTPLKVDNVSASAMNETPDTPGEKSPPAPPSGKWNRRRQNREERRQNNTVKKTTPPPPPLKVDNDTPGNKSPSPRPSEKWNRRRQNRKERRQNNTVKKTTPPPPRCAINETPDKPSKTSPTSQPLEKRNRRRQHRREYRQRQQQQKK